MASATTSEFFKVNVAVVGKAQQLNEYKLIMKYGLINFKGEEITEFKYDFIDEFSYDVAIVKMDGKFGLINFKGVEITPIIYDSISTIKFKSGAKAVLNGIEGWITLDGHFLNEKPPHKKT